jgi:hypothetical protein
MSAPIVALVRKDVRALLPLWSAAAVTVAADPLLRGTSVQSLLPLGPFAYILGSLTLGAHVVGHEYSHRTLGSLFAQPCRRSSILLVKAGVLLTMLLALSILAWPTSFAAGAGLQRELPRVPTVPLAIAGALLVAPWITMRLRSQIAGVVFTASIPGVAYLVALVAGIMIHGVGAAESFATAVWIPTVSGLAAAGGFLSVRAFLRLQDADGGQHDLELPRWATVTDRNPVRPALWMLTKKELRLQQLTFAMPVVFGFISAALVAAARLNPEFGREFPIRGVGLLYFALLPLVIGALASAQERQFGTWQSQAMLPVPFAQQWAVKAGVVLLLAFALGGVPLFVLVPSNVPRDTLLSIAVVIPLLAAWSLYLSSWAPNGIVALAVVLPATAAALVAARGIDGVVESLGAGHTFAPFASLPLPPVAAVLTASLVLCAGSNHRRIDRTIARLAVQGASLLVIFAAADLLVTALA